MTSLMIARVWLTVVGELEENLRNDGGDSLPGLASEIG
jgi:hypothetical protein